MPNNGLPGQIKFNIVHELSRCQRHVLKSNIEEKKIQLPVSRRKALGKHKAILDQDS